MLRILHMIGCLEMGGSQTMVMNLYRKIDRTRVQFDFIVDRLTPCVFNAEIESMGGRIFYLPKLNGRNFFAVRKAWDTFFTEHPEYKILHSHVRSYASVYFPIAHKHHVKTIIHSHSTSNGAGFSALVKGILQYPLRYQADYFFACSLPAGEWLFGKRVTRGAAYRTIRNPVDVEKFRFNDAVRQAVRRELHLAPDQHVYGHIGRLHPAKNHAFLLEVFAAIHARDPRARLLIVGEGDLRPDIEASITRLHLTDSVQMLGLRTDSHRLLQAMDCFLFPSLWEGLGLSVIEAQAAGLPCYLSDTLPQEVSLSDLVHFLPISQGAELWADAVCRDPLQRKDVTQEIVRAGYDAADTARKLENFYLKLAAEET